jgi:hypothetical protein
MSSSNLVRLAYIPETVYGETPVAGSFRTARFTSEGLSGTPGTTESQQIRTDRMSSGQIVTGLTVGGELAFELAKEPSIDDFLASAMLNNWSTLGVITAALTIDAAAKEMSRAAGSFAGDGLVVGDFITLANFTDAENNTTIMIAEFVDADTIRYVGPATMKSGSGSGTTLKRADKLTIGATKKSFSMEKTFLDLNNKAIVYRGMLVNSMELNVAFGELIGGSFSFSGNDYKSVSQAADFITNTRTILPAATTNTFNGSVDMPFLGSSAVGDLDESGLDIQSVSISLNNNLSAQNVIGDIAPRDYSPGTAAIEVSINSYLKDAAWAMQARKLDQSSFGLGFMVRNQGGFYAFYLPAIQVSFDDPSSGGQNQDITLDMSGRAKVGDNGESALTIYRSTT